MHLFAVLKLRANNKRELLPGHPVMRRWWVYMQDLMYTQPDGRPNEWPLTPMFHFD
jgi:L-rhamnose mutarotase